MTPETVHMLMTQAMMVILKISLPLLLSTLIVGLLISLIQALTQIQENSLSFVPKLLVLFGVLALCLPYIGQTLTHFGEEIFQYIRLPQGVLS